jgi:nondiscriminating glutamyl-tRNA synthetase
VRFAPSPTGGLHIGSARTALYNYLFARHHGGDFLVRIEDTDVARSESRHEASILADLRWLGLGWDEGPDIGGPSGPYRQSERAAHYRAAAEALVRDGRAYPCFCSRERLDAVRAEQLARGGTPLYDGRCAGLSPDEAERRRAAGEAAALRLRVPPRQWLVDDLIRGPVEFGPQAFRDFIIIRSNADAAYNFAAAVDDRDMGITHVIRGDDHLTNTARQLAVYAALGADPPRYAHHSLVLGPDGGKLSKRHGATTIGDFRELGYLPAAIANYLALLSWSHGEDEVLGLDRLERDFEIERLSASPAVFDAGKLDWLDHQHIMLLDDETHLRLVAERLPAGTAPSAAAALAAALKPSISRYDEVPPAAAPVLEPPSGEDFDERVAVALPQLSEFAARRAAAEEWIDEAAARGLLAAYRAWAKEAGIKVRDALMPVRLALTGCEHGPDLHFVVSAIARGDALTRLARAGATLPPAGA